jgi:hypothetical protein
MLAKGAWVAVILGCLIGALALAAHSHLPYTLIFAVIGAAAASPSSPTPDRPLAVKREPRDRR